MSDTTVESPVRASRPLRVGIIGAGDIVSSIHLPVLRTVPGITVSWVMDVNEAKAREVARRFGIPSALGDLTRCPDVDAVLIATPVGARRKAWDAVFERGWHAFCEKPVATARAEFERIVTAMRANQRTLGVGLMRRYYSGTRLLRKMVTERVFGAPAEVWAAEGGRQTRSGKDGDWYQLDRALAGGGVLIETGSHLLDQIMFVTRATDATLERYAQRPAALVMEFDARVEGTLTMPASGAVPFSAIISRSTDVCNGIFVRFDSVVLALQPGADGAVELRELDNRVIARLDSAGGGATNSFSAFHGEWTDFAHRCAANDVNADAVALTGLSVGLIADCYDHVQGAIAEVAQ